MYVEFATPATALDWITKWGRESPKDERVGEQSGDGLESMHECFASRFARMLIACKHHKFNLRTAMATRP